MATIYGGEEAIEPGDKIIEVPVRLTVKVNYSAYKRAYPRFDESIGDVKWGTRQSILEAVENGDLFPQGILIEASVKQ
jgi:hypothetical protein